MIPYVNPTTLDQQSPSAPSNWRPELRRIAKELQMKLKAPPPSVRLGIANCHSVYKEIPICEKHDHLKAWRAKVRKRVQSKFVRELKRSLGRPIFHRVFDWGVLILEDSSCETGGDFYWGVKLRIVLNAVLQNPMLADKFHQGEQCYSLELALENLLAGAIADAYMGPGIAVVDEGDYLWESVTVEVFGDVNEALDSTRVAEELAKVFDGDLNRRIGGFASMARYIYAQIRRS